MAFFGITIEKIGKIWKHPKADKLELASCAGLGFQLCVGKGVYQVGDEVLYFPVDTILPEEFKEKIGIRAPGRIKTIKLRDEYSQGFVFSLTAAQNIFGVDFKNMSVEELTLYFKATKYEPAQKFSGVGELLPLPVGQGIYDIENISRHLSVFDSLLEQECVITEKLEGTNIAVSKYDGVVYVCQRANSIKEKDGVANAYCEAARKSGLIEKIEKISGNNIVLIGELIGPSIQDNIYKIDQHKILLFDIKVDGRWLAAKEFYQTCKLLNIETVPVIAQGVLKDILTGRAIESYADGFSILFNTLREGIIIRPVAEQYDPELRRVILKQHSLRYMAQS